MDRFAYYVEQLTVSIIVPSRLYSTVTCVSTEVTKVNTSVNY